MTHFSFTCPSTEVCRYVPMELLTQAAILYCLFYCYYIFNRSLYCHTATLYLYAVNIYCSISWWADDPKDISIHIHTHTHSAHTQRMELWGWWVDDDMMVVAKYNKNNNSQYSSYTAASMNYGRMIWSSVTTRDKFIPYLSLYLTKPVAVNSETEKANTVLEVQLLLVKVVTSPRFEYSQTHRRRTCHCNTGINSHVSSLHVYNAAVWF